MDSRVMACGVQADAMHAVDKVSVWRVDGRWGNCVRGRVACMADHMRQVRVTKHRWTNEKVKGEGDGEVLRVREGEEGVMRLVRIRVRQATPEAEGATASASIQHAGSAGGGGGVEVIEGEESTGCYHCRGGSLSMWVASSI